MGHKFSTDGVCVCVCVCVCVESVPKRLHYEIQLSPNSVFSDNTRGFTKSLFLSTPIANALTIHDYKIRVQSLILPQMSIKNDITITLNIRISLLINL